MTITSCFFTLGSWALCCCCCSVANSCPILCNPMDCITAGSPVLHYLLGFPVAQMVKNLSAMQETQVWSLGQEDPLEKEMAIHSSILAWKIPWTEEAGGPQSMGSQRVGHDWATNTDGVSSNSCTIESVMPSKHLILYYQLLLLPSTFPSITVFSRESALCIKWPKYWSFSFIISELPIQSD